MSDWTRPGPRALAAEDRGSLPEGDAAERTLARVVAIGLPLASLAGAIAASVLAGPGSALLVLASGALLGTIALLWASLRTLSGDAPLPENLDDGSHRPHQADDLLERKRRALRALKDLEGEHALGKIDDDDYETLATRYREEAKEMLRELDRQTGPGRAEAERLAQDYLARRAQGGVNGAPSTRADSPQERKPRRFACPRCKASNEADASFCKRCGSALETSAS